MATLRVVLGDQLSETMSSLVDIDTEHDTVLMAEVREEATYVRHHKQKIAFLFSAMRHFGQLLVSHGADVVYVDYLHDHNKGSIVDQIKWQLTESQFDRVVIAHPGEYRLLAQLRELQQQLDIPLDILEDNRFIVDHDFFGRWAQGKKQLRMEFFYREVRKLTGYLMEGNQPIGGKWNYDAQNRESLPKDQQVPDRTVFEYDAITRDVLALVNEHFTDHFGELENFAFAVTRDQALTVLEAFIDERLPNFGRFQDAMAMHQPWLFHSHISFYLNCGLLHPQEVVERALAEYENGTVPLNSVEGFVRQVIGWREYVRGFYWHFMPGLKEQNALNATRALPSFFWSGNTRMNCLSQCINETKENAYAHHIQRLMVIGNFALLAGLDPCEVNDWYLLVYADAYEWVELPNVSSMILYADNGNLASKPYAASGSYINKMSNYCQHCEYSVKEKTGPQACPFNYLYWDFAHRHQATLSNNPRMAMIYRTFAKMDPTHVNHMLKDASSFLTKLENDEEV